MNPYATDRQMHDEGVSFEYVYKVRDDIKEGDTVIEVELEEPAPVRVKTPRGNRTPRGARKADKAARSEKSGDKTPRDGRRTPRGGADDDEATSHDDGPTKKVRVKGEKKRKASKADDDADEDADDDDADVNLAEKTLGEYWWLCVCVCVCVDWTVIEFCIYACVFVASVRNDIAETKAATTERVCFRTLFLFNFFFSIFLCFIKVLAATADERNVIKDQVYVLQQMQSDRLKVFLYFIFLYYVSIINNNFFDNRLQQMNKQD